MNLNEHEKLPVQDQKHGELSTWIKWTILKDKNIIPDFGFTVKVNASFLGGREGSEGTRTRFGVSLESNIKTNSSYCKTAFWSRAKVERKVFNQGEICYNLGEK